MNSNKPVQLSQKIDYLFQKISRMHSQIRKNDDIELRLNFEQFIDTCIRSILTIKDASSPIKNKVKQTKNKSQNVQNLSVQAQKLDFQKKMVKYQIKQLETKQLQVQFQTLRLKLTNKQKQFDQLRQEKADLRRQNLRQIQRINDKTKFLEQEIEKLVKLNKAQQQQMKIIREQRRRAQAKYIQLQEKYDEQVAKLQKFQDKKPRYIDRSTQGLRCTRYYTNISTVSNSRKLISLKLPVTLEVNKLIYGIMVGVQLNNSKEVGYYDKFQLYEKQITRIQVEGDWLVATYKRRKQNVRVVLDKYVVRIPQLVVMLFGKGDSIMVHDEPNNNN